MAGTLSPNAATCAGALNLTAQNPGQFSDSETALTAAQAAATAAWDISQIAYTLLLAETPALPLLPFVSLAFAIDELISAFGSGRPKFQDTQDVINAYNESAYWPLHALASDMAIWVKNGAPISDSNPAVQATFSAAKQGTIESIQQTAGWPAGPSSPGYWQLQRLINQSWVDSGGGQAAVAKVVQAIDRYTQILACLHAQQSTTTPPPGGGGGTPPPQQLPNNCQSSNPDTDEIVDMCNNLSFQLSEIYDQLINGFTGLAGQGNDQCCTNVVTAITQVARQLTIIAAALAIPGSKPLNIDFTPIVQAIAQLAAAVSANEPLTKAIADALTSGLPAIASAITNAPATDVSAIVDQLKVLVREGDVAQPIIDYLVQGGYLSGADAQVLAGAPWGDAFYVMLRTYAWNALQWALKQAGILWNGTKLALPAVSAGITNDIDGAISAALTAGAAPVYPAIKGMVDAVVGILSPTSLPSIGQINVDPDLLISKTLAPVLIINAVALLADYLGWEISEQLREYVTLAAEFVGLQEVRELKVGQAMRWGPMREAELRAKGTYRQELAGLGAMASWTARGLYDVARYNGLAPLTGTPPEQVQPTLEAAYSGLGARRILPLIQTGLFSQADIADELTFSGLRPASMKRYLLAAPFLATQTERNQLKTELENAYVAGVLSDADLTSAIDSAENNTDRDNLILTRVHYQKLVASTKALETEYITLYKAGLFTQVQLTQNLTAIGLQPDVVSAKAAVAEAQVNATLHRKELAAAAALERATAAEERKAAMKNFTTGNINAAALAVALIATGLTATQAAAWADLAILQKAGGLRWKYGLQLPAAQATLLGQRVTALTDQRKRQQISDAQYVAGLQALGIPPTYVNALQATADALISPKTSAFAIPVQT